MGNLHAGHLALVRAAGKECSRVLVSIFVNPLQFGPGEDFQTYPRTLDEDLEALREAGVDGVFAPTVQEMYPTGTQPVTRVTVSGLGDLLCGRSRPGHFDGVTTVVSKLFNIVMPDVAVFGEKDYQQLTIVRRMAADLCFPVRIVGHPTQRESDGLALSSRNQYLSKAERAVAPALYRTLRAAADELACVGCGENNRHVVAIQQAGMDNLTREGLDPEYFEIRESGSLALPGPGSCRLVILAAAKLGGARLIDNLSVALT
jgi:pantoate--beta-alanine ligase